MCPSDTGNRPSNCHTGQSKKIEGEKEPFFNTRPFTSSAITVNLRPSSRSRQRRSKRRSELWYAHLSNVDVSGSSALSPPPTTVNAANNWQTKSIILQCFLSSQNPNLQSVTNRSGVVHAKLWWRFIWIRARGARFEGEPATGVGRGFGGFPLCDLFESGQRVIRVGSTAG